LEEQIDPRAFRDAAGQFATGVTVITTRDGDGTPIGLTANSFTSVSLDPPMVLFCLGKNSDTLAAFESGNGFAVHVLSADQLELSVRFASKGIDRFDGLEWTPGVGGAPVLAGALVVFECSATHSYDGGDHVIFVGTVERLGVVDDSRPALGYFRGGYTETGG
jgi:flavin reductase (DIM6/NTAB) family NADH-FMN oxidoreductase RutF